MLGSCATTMFHMRKVIQNNHHILQLVYLLLMALGEDSIKQSWCMCSHTMPHLIIYIIKRKFMCYQERLVVRPSKTNFLLSLSSLILVFIYFFFHIRIKYRILFINYLLFLPWHIYFLQVFHIIWELFFCRKTHY